jgi:hypothetical protein
VKKLLIGLSVLIGVTCASAGEFYYKVDTYVSCDLYGTANTIEGKSYNGEDIEGLVRLHFEEIKKDNGIWFDAVQDSRVTIENPENFDISNQDVNTSHVGGTSNDSIRFIEAKADFTINSLNNGEAEKLVMLVFPSFSGQIKEVRSSNLKIKAYDDPGMFQSNETQIKLEDTDNTIYSLTFSCEAEAPSVVSPHYLNYFR